MNLLFYNTLFDENAACHFALGRGYSECVRGGEAMEEAALLEAGVNQSLVHVDFMVGTRDLGVVEDRAGMENFVSSWLAQKNAAAQEGIVYRIAQDITYEEVRIDAAYCATLEEVENAFVKHATLDLA